jgi:hypothetical protein
MKSRAGFLTILVAQCAVGGGLSGTWEGTFADADKSYAGFDLSVSGNQVNGDAYLALPSLYVSNIYHPVSDGRVDGNQFSLTVNHMRFEGEIKGDTMSLAGTPDGTPAATLQRTVSHVAGPVTAGATAKNLQGRWETRWTGKIGERPKMIGDMLIDFKVDGNGLTGVVHTGVWPGDCPITDVKIDLGRISFTATGRIPSSTGIPILRFAGEIHDDGLRLTMRHQIFGADNGDGLPMDAERK